MALKKIVRICRSLFGNRPNSIVTGFVLEALEPRLLLSADPIGFSVTIDPSSDTSNQQLQSIENPELLENLITSLAHQTDPGIESRTLFSGELPASLKLDALSSLMADKNETAATSNRTEILIAAPPLALTTELPDEALVGQGPESAQRHELLFVDTRTPDYLQLLDGIQSTDSRVAYEIHILDPNRDGIAQISNVLAQYQQIDAVHFISHGNEGTVQLGNNWLSQQSLNDYTNELTGWSQALSKGADLLFYGCNLAATTEGGSLINALSRLTGADVAASNNLTGNTALGGDWELEYHTGQIEALIAVSTPAQEQWNGSLGSSDPLWLTTDNHVNSGGQPVSGLDTWKKADLVAMGDPNLGFEQAGITDGSFSMGFDADFFAPGKNVDGVHYVSADIQLGSSNFQLQAGDLLLTGDGTTWTGNSSAPPAGFSNSLDVGKEDVLVFRPDTPGDYGTGSFALLLENPANAELRGITLIEQDTTVGDANLQAGDFLFTRTGGAEDEDVWLFQTADVGSLTTSGSVSVLLEGSDANVQIDKVNGIDLVETTTTIGGMTFDSGTILLTSDASVAGSNALVIEKHDIYALNVTQTSLVAGVGNGTANASLAFDGSDVAFDSGAEKLDGFTLTVSNNQAPVVATTPAAPLSYSILDPATEIDPLATATDADSTDLNGGSLTASISTGVTINDTLSVKAGGNVTLSGSDVLVSGVTIGTIDAAKDGTNGADLLIDWNSNSTDATIQEVLRQIAYHNTSGTPDTSTRIVDFVLTDGDGGSSALAQQSINYTGIAAPTLSMSGSAAVYTEGDVSPVIIDPGATVADSDSTDFNTGTLTVVITTNGSSSDTLSVMPGGNVTLSGSDIQVSGTTIGAIDAVNDGTAGNPLIITWNLNSTPATAQEVVRQIAFENSSEDPSSLSRTLSFTLSDGDGGTSLSTTQQVEVHAVNDAPGGTSNNVSTIEETTYTFVSTDFGFSDVLDSDNFNAVKITSLPALGTLTNNAVAVNAGDFISVADIELGLLTYTPPQDGAGTAYTNFTFQVQDTGGTINGGVNLDPVAKTMTIDVTNINDAPIGLPGITGSVQENQTLTVDTTGISDGDGLGTFSYQWQRDGVDIAGATNSSYTLTDTDVGTAITVVASYTDGQGGSESVTSAATAAVANVNDTPTGAVILSGSAIEDQTLTATNTLADADGLGTVSYQWQRDGVDIAGATNSSYTLTDTDVGTAITVVASYTDGQGSSESVTSAATTAVANVNDTPTGAVILSGSAIEDQTLTATNTLADADGLGTVSYQWQRDGVDIAGATNSSHTLTDTDVGAAITVVASYTDGQGGSESVTSAATAPVANVNDTPTGAVTLSGSAIEGQTLTATNTLADDDGLGTVSYQWQRDGVDIAGATNSSYTLTDTDVGAAITVVASYTDGQGGSESVTSAATAAVAVFIPEPPPTISAPTPVIDKGPTEVIESETEEVIENTAEKASEESGEQTEEAVEEQPGDINPTDDTGELIDPLEQYADTGLTEVRFVTNGIDTGKNPSFQLKATLLSVMKAIQVASPGWDGVLNSESIDPMMLLQSSGFNRELDELREDVTQQIQYDKIVASSTVAASTGLSIGYAAYLLRGGVLVSSVLTSLPAWTFIDPAPVLAMTKGQSGNEEDDEDESLRSMVENSDKNSKDDADSKKHE